MKSHKVYSINVFEGLAEFKQISFAVESSGEL